MTLTRKITVLTIAISGLTLIAWLILQALTAANVIPTIGKTWGFFIPVIAFFISVWCLVIIDLMIVNKAPSSTTEKE